MSRNRAKKDSLDQLKESYNLLVEIMENPQKMGWIAVLTKTKPESREPINIKLFDFKNEVDRELSYLSRRILRKIGMDNLTDGSK